MAKSNKFGTFGGVFTPSILTILGVIMYLRLPMIIGQAGLVASIGIILVAHLISVTTGLSVSSIATDKKVEGGGTYYMISRSLGLPIGGTLGLALFVGLSFSVSLYLIGFSESFLNYFGFADNIENIRLTGTIVLLLVTIITFISTSLAIKTQYIIMAAIILSLISVFLGKHDLAPSLPFVSDPTTAVPIMVLFGIFFPAVTGFEAGVSMSGDLKDPKKSIPLGAISAIAVGLVVYIALAFYFSYTVDRNELANDPNILFKIAWIPELVVAGIWGATLSSALGSILGAPRILQATATDRITHKFFAKGTKKTNEPRNALLMTFVIAEVGILIGDLNVIARIVSIFFITTYGFLNLSCAFERLTSADFRPLFKTPAWVSIIGALACLIVMIQLDFVALLGGSIILGIVYLFIRRKEIQLESGDAWSGIWSSLVNFGLDKLHVDTINHRNWRPNIIMFSGEELSRPYMIQLGQDICGKLGLLTGFELEVTDDPVLTRKSELMTEKSKKGYFINHHSCHDLYSGMDEIIRVYGFNGIEPNTILMGWSKNEKNKSKFGDLISRLEKNNFNSIYLNYNPERKTGNSNSIDIWWSGWGNNLSFSLYLLRHLTSSTSWNSPKIRLLVISNDPSKIDIYYNSLTTILEEYRITIEIKIINNSIEQLTRNEIIKLESGNTDLTIVGIPDKKFQDVEKTYNEVNGLTENMGTMLFINASANFKEYSLKGIDQKTIQKEISKSTTIILPELITTKYEVLNKHLHHFDERGLEIISEFYKKVFVPYFKEQNEYIRELKKLNITIFGKLNKTINKLSTGDCIHYTNEIQHELYSEALALTKQFLSDKMEIQKSVLTSGLEWYDSQLIEEILVIPQKVTIDYPISEFRIQPTDSKSVRRHKRLKKLLNPFAKSSISDDVELRKLSRFYIQQNRQQNLKITLKELNTMSLQFNIDIKNWLFVFDNQLEIFCNEFAENNSDKLTLSSIQSDLMEKITLIEEATSKYDLHFRNSMLEEFRQNIQLLAYDLDKVEANKAIDKRKRPDKFYKDLAEENKNYPKEWFETILPVANKLQLDLQVLELKNRVQRQVFDYYTSTKTLIYEELTNKIDIFKSNLLTFNRNKDDNNKIVEIKIVSGFYNSDEIMNKFQESIMEMIEQLPEEVSIYSQPITRVNYAELQENELITIPLQKMIRHFAESLLIGEMQDGFEVLGNKLKRITYRIKDQVSYMHFEIENLKDANENKSAETIINDVLSNINESETEIELLLKNLKSATFKSIENAFEPLYSHKILDSTKELPHIIREYHGKKNIGKVDRFFNAIKEITQKVTVRLLYSQSEGILLARLLNKQEYNINSSESYLNLVDLVSPNPTVYTAIPSYYKNLFSGKSSISDDFWIEKKEEELKFAKAIEHYKAGYRGGILITGERNTGKTTFCQHVARKHFNQQAVYNIFPPLQGSVTVSDFQHELNNALNIEGSIYKIFENLPEDSVLFFHDIELWWESSDKGLTIIKLLLDLIKKYSDKCLFVVNLNSATYEHIQKTQNISNSFISIITCKPFNSEDLKEMIMVRHRSRGMKFIFENKPEDGISELKLAGLFNKYFNFSKGNPGAALYAWIANVKSFENDQLEIRSPQKPNLLVFENLPDDWKVILYQISLHKRMTISKMKNVLLINESKIVLIVEAFIRAGLIKEKSAGVFVINPYIDNFITDYITTN
ncbi:MAG: amino acid permease [Paludibacter sp.]|nr:amino acid permease [Paludibacter sp.]